MVSFFVGALLMASIMIGSSGPGLRKDLCAWLCLIAGVGLSIWSLQ